MSNYLETERLVLRNYKETDLEDYWEFVSMESVGPRAGWPAYTDKQKAYERLKTEIQKQNQLAIVLKEENKVIGSIELMDCKKDRYNNLNIEAGAKEIGFILSEKYWGRGIMTEALKRVMKYAFEELNVPVIYIGHAKANVASGRVQEKCGFKKIGEVENYRVWIDGTNTNLIERRMTKEEYLEMRHIKNK